MRILSLITLFALATSAPLIAAEMDNHGGMMAANATCPMCMKPVGDKPEMTKVTVGEGDTAKSFMIACDSKMCSDAFMKDPEAVFKKTYGKDAAGPKTQYK